MLIIGSIQSNHLFTYYAVIKPFIDNYTDAIIKQLKDTLTLLLTRINYTVTLFFSFLFFSLIKINKSGASETKENKDENGDDPRKRGYDGLL